MNITNITEVEDYDYFYDWYGFFKRYFKRDLAMFLYKNKDAKTKVFSCVITFSFCSKSLAN